MIFGPLSDAQLRTLYLDEEVCTEVRLDAFKETAHRRGETPTSTEAAIAIINERGDTVFAAAFPSAIQ